MRRLSRESRDALRGVHTIIAANRGPVVWAPADATHPGGHPVRSEGGGLITAMGSLAHATSATWVATASSNEADLVAASQRGPIPDGTGAAYEMRYVQPSKGEYSAYYSTIANPLLWFVQHYLWDVPVQPLITDETMEAWDRGYATVNRLFADAIIADAKSSRKPPLVMLQDYHLYLAPQMIRDACPSAVIQHFVHIPWPAPEYLRILPAKMRTEILTGMLGNDIIGFQTHRDARNFGRCCEDFLGATLTADGDVVHGSRMTALRDYPISLDVEAFNGHAAHPATRVHRAEIQSWRPEHLIVRVDRLDPSKNVLRGFLAYERMLDAHPELVGKTQFYAFMQPSRGDINEYQRYAATVAREVDRINARADLRGPNGEPPIRCEFGQDIHRAVAAYQEYDVLLVNPVWDGMNLVAKDGPWVNTRNGVVLLSDGAGSHQELGDLALSIDPFHLDDMARALHQGIVMPQAERKGRRDAIVAHLRANDLTRWLERQVADIGRALPGRTAPGRDGIG